MKEKELAPAIPGVAHTLMPDGSIKSESVEPFLTVDDDQAVAKADCGCQLEATHPPGAAIWLCSMHEAAEDLLEALQNLENDSVAIPMHAWDMVGAAIQKATRPERLL